MTILQDPRKKHHPFPPLEKLQISYFLLSKKEIFQSQIFSHLQQSSFCFFRPNDFTVSMDTLNDKFSFSTSMELQSDSSKAFSIDHLLDPKYMATLIHWDTKVIVVNPFNESLKNLLKSIFLSKIQLDSFFFFFFTFHNSSSLYRNSLLDRH